MFRSSFAAGAIALMAVAPAAAQSPTGSSSNGMANGTMSNGNVPSGAMAATMSCAEMMTKERAHTANARGAALTIAQNQMILADRRMRQAMKPAARCTRRTR